MTAAWVLLLLTACAPKHLYPDGTGLQGQLEREVIALNKKLYFLENSLATCGEKPKPDRLYNDLHQLFSKSSVSVQRQGSSTLISLPASFLFRSDGVSLRVEALSAVDLIATALSLHKNHIITIEGHTDDSLMMPTLDHPERSNWELAFSRSASVLSAFVKRFGLQEERFTIASRGEFGPITENDSRAGRAANHRIVLRLQPPAVSR